MEPLQKGTVVRVTAGKGKNSIFIVVADQKAKGVYLADGRHRKLANPKLKNVKHVEVLGRGEVPQRDRLLWKSLSSYRGA